MILERDRRVIACAALYPYSEEKIGEIACVATHPDYRGAGRAEQLLSELLDQASALSLTHVFALTTQSTHWFLEQGFDAGHARSAAGRKTALLQLATQCHRTEADSLTLIARQC